MRGRATNSSRVNGLSDAFVTKQRKLVGAVRARLDRELDELQQSLDGLLRRQLSLDAVETPPPASAIPALAVALDRSLLAVTMATAGSMAHERERVRSLLNQLNAELNQDAKDAFKKLQTTGEKRIAQQRDEFEKEVASMRSAGSAEVAVAKARDEAMVSERGRLEAQRVQDYVEKLERELEIAQGGSNAQMEELGFKVEALQNRLRVANSRVATLTDANEGLMDQAAEMRGELSRYRGSMSREAGKKGGKRPLTADQQAEVTEQVAAAKKLAAASNLAAKREASQAMGKAARIVKSIARHEKTIATMHGRVNEGREEVASWKSKYKAEKTKTDDMRIELIEATRKLSRQKLEHTTTGAHAAKYSDGLEDDIAMLSSQRTSLVAKLKDARMRVKTSKADAFAHKQDRARAEAEAADLRERHAELLLHLMNVVDALLHGPVALRRLVHGLSTGRAAAEKLVAKRLQVTTREELYRLTWAKSRPSPGDESSASTPTRRASASAAAAPCKGDGAFELPERRTEAEEALDEALPLARLRHLAPLRFALELELRVQIEPEVKRRLETEFREKMASRFRILVDAAVEKRTVDAINRVVENTLARHSWNQHDWVNKCAEVEAALREIERSAHVATDSHRRMTQRLLQQTQDEKQRTAQSRLAAQEKDKLVLRLVERLRLALVRLEQSSEKNSFVRTQLADERDRVHDLQTELAVERGEIPPPRRAATAASCVARSADCLANCALVRAGRPTRPRPVHDDSRRSLPLTAATLLDAHHTYLPCRLDLVTPEKLIKEPLVVNKEAVAESKQAAVLREALFGEFSGEHEDFLGAGGLTTFGDVGVAQILAFQSRKKERAAKTKR